MQPKPIAGISTPVVPSFRVCMLSSPSVRQCSACVVHDSTPLSGEKGAVILVLPLPASAGAKAVVWPGISGQDERMHYAGREDAPMLSDERRREIADFLKTRRMRRQPEELGLPRGRPRPPPGPRRAE